MSEKVEFRVNTANSRMLSEWQFAQNIDYPKYFEELAQVVNSVDDPLFPFKFQSSLLGYHAYDITLNEEIEFLDEKGENADDREKMTRMVLHRWKDIDTKWRTSHAHLPYSIFDLDSEFYKTLFVKIFS